MLALGFGFVEAGTVTPRPQPGNSGQRLFRLAEDEAVINRFGFNSCGIAPFAGRLAKRRAASAKATRRARHRRRQSRQEPRHRRRRRRLHRLHRGGVGLRGLPRRQHLLAEHAGAAGPAGARPDRGPARPRTRRAAPSAGGAPAAAAGEGRPRSRRRRNTRHRGGGAGDRRRRAHRRQHHGGAAADLEEPAPLRAGRSLRQAAARPLHRLPRRHVPAAPAAKSRSSDAEGSRAGPTPMPRSAPAPRWWRSIRRWCSTGRRWSAASSASLPRACAPTDLPASAMRWEPTSRGPRTKHRRSLSQ